MLPRVAVHFGEADRKAVHLGKAVQTPRSGENEQAQFTGNVF